VTWHNASRVDAYDLSPWDRTLVLDADYVVASSQLAPLLQADRDFLAHRHAYDVTGCNDFAGLDTFGEHRMPMWWATVMMFRRSRHAELVFGAMRMIRDHWQHYRRLYKIRQTTYRNDHALSIALLICNGHVLKHDAIPWSLATVLPETKLSLVHSDQYRADFIDQENKPRWVSMRQDFHAMGKTQLEAIVAGSA
jgi:hypothetical protein